MADLKEETPVDNTEQVQAEETVVERKRQLDPSKDKMRIFYEKNKKAVNYIGGGFVLLMGAILFFKGYYLPEREKEAANEMFWAQDFFERDSFNLALNGGIMVMSPDGQKQMMGFAQVADEYGITKTGNLANYYAGICYMRTGKFEQAIESLSKFDGKDGIIAPIALGAIGDCHMELNHAEDAIKYYVKASKESNNSFTTPYYLKKAAFGFEMQGNLNDALSMYERIRKEYSSSEPARDISKDIARVKALGNL